MAYSILSLHICTSGVALNHLSILIQKHFTLVMSVADPGVVCLVWTPLMSGTVRYKFESTADISKACAATK